MMKYFASLAVLLVLAVSHCSADSIVERVDKLIKNRFGDVSGQDVEKLKIILTGLDALMREIGNNLPEKRDVGLDSLFGVKASASDDLDADIEARLQTVFGSDIDKSSSKPILVKALKAVDSLVGKISDNKTNLQSFLAVKIDA